MEGSRLTGSGCFDQILQNGNVNFQFLCSNLDNRWHWPYLIPEPLLTCSSFPGHLLQFSEKEWVTEKDLFCTLLVVIYLS